MATYGEGLAKLQAERAARDAEAQKHVAAVLSRAKPTPAAAPTDPVQERIAAALERIADALEKAKPLAFFP